MKKSKATGIRVAAMAMSYLEALTAILALARGGGGGASVVVAFLAILASVLVNIPKVGAQFVGSFIFFVLAILYFLSLLVADWTLWWPVGVGLWALSAVISLVFPVLIGIFSMISAVQLYRIELEESGD